MNPVPASLPELESTLHAIVDQASIPSVAYGVWRQGETILLGSTGLADKDTGQKATPATPYAMASVTKPMTATAVALLASRGHFGFDDAINPLLGDAKIQSRSGNADLATVRQVADHSAGLGVHCQFYYEDEPVRRPPIEETALRYAKTLAAPGQFHRYSNLGYGLLEHLISRVSGRPYAEFMAEEIFEPLGMRRTTIGPPSGERALSYGPDGVAYPRYDFDHPGGSAAYSTVEDLLAFGAFHLGSGPALMPKEQLAELHRATAQIDDIRGYGFGWGTNVDRLGYGIVQHTGFMGGVSTVLRLVPEEDLVIAILLNGQGDLAWRSADDVMAALLTDFRERLVIERSTPPSPNEPTPVPTDLIQTWSGTVETHAGNRSLALRIADSVAVLDGIESPIEDLRFASGRLQGVFDGDIGTEDAGRRPYRLHLDLAPAGDELQGSLLALWKGENGGGGQSEKRMGAALAYWTKLSAASSAQM